jgi:carbonic anhydrase
MDPRLTEIWRRLGLAWGEADIMRNAGSVITEDTVRSPLVATGVLGSNEIMIVNHTGRGMLTFTDDEIASRLERMSNAAPISPERFYSFTDLSAATREQVHRARTHPQISKDVPIRGFVYEVETGGFHEIDYDGEA